jgi:hypothetical protein
MAKRPPIKKLSAASRKARTVQPRVKSAKARRATVSRATSRVKAKTSINFTRSVRGK